MANNSLYLCGEVAKSVVKALKIGQKVNLSVMGRVTELSEREPMEYMIGPEQPKSKKKKGPEYEIRVDVSGVNNK